LPQSGPSCQTERRPFGYLFSFLIEIVVYTHGERERERAEKQCQYIACARSFYTVLIWAEGQMLEGFKRITNNIFKTTMKI
jgi:hypothetical protein